MSIFASILRSVYKLSGAKKAFALPEDALRKEIEKQNQHHLAKIGDGMMKMQIVKINF